MDSVLAHIATKYLHRENIATDALVYVLSRSPAARRGLGRALTATAVDDFENLDFSSQESFDSGIRPDVVGRRADQAVLLLEAKFWAGLTEKQPLAYLEQLPNDRAGAVVFVAPDSRLVSLWSEIQRAATGLTLSAVPAAGDARVKSVDGTRKRLMLVSWRQILDAICAAPGLEPQRAADMGQLRGLVESIDEAAFRPLRPDELASSNGQRIIEYCRFVDTVSDDLARNYPKLVSMEPGRASREGGRYIRRLRLRGNGCNLYFSPLAWARDGDTPLWLLIGDAQRRRNEAARDKLRGIVAEQLVVTPDAVRVQLRLPTGVGEQQVVDELVRQVVEIANALPDAAAAPADDG